MRSTIIFTFLILVFLAGCNSVKNNSSIHEKILRGKSPNWECTLMLRYDRNTDTLEQKAIITHTTEITQGPLRLRCEIPGLGSVNELNTGIKTPRKTFATGGSSSGSLNKFDSIWDYYDRQTDSAFVVVKWIDQGIEKEEKIDLK